MLERHVGDVKKRRSTQAEVARADAEFEHGTTRPGELEHPIDGCADVGDVGVPLVVHVGEPVAVRTLVVSPHPPEATANYIRGQTRDVTGDRLHRGSDP